MERLPSLLPEQQVTLLNGGTFDTREGDLKPWRILKPNIQAYTIMYISSLIGITRLFFTKVATIEDCKVTQHISLLYQTFLKYSSIILTVYFSSSRSYNIHRLNIFNLNMLVGISNLVHSDVVVEKQPRNQEKVGELHMSSEENPE